MGRWHEEEERPRSGARLQRPPRPQRQLEAKVPLPAHASRRQQLVALIERRPMGFEELRYVLGMTVRDLDEALAHVDRSLRRENRRLEVTPAVCSSCGFRFTGREARHFHPPSRCPRCKGERIEDPRFGVTSGRG